MTSKVRRAARGGWGQPVFRFGIVADVQYADREDAYNFSGTRLRRYRQAKEIWEESVQWWLEEKVNFIAQLGDLIDGSNRENDMGICALQTILRPLGKAAPPTLHLVGNHELYNFTRNALEAGIKVPGISLRYSVAAPKVLNADDTRPGRAYYSFRPCAGWRVCVLDPYDISLLRPGGGRPGIDLGKADLDPVALEMCQAHNPNDITKEDFAKGMPEGPGRRWVPFNGALGEEQLAWLRETLRLAHSCGERTVLLSHVVLHPEATPGGNGFTLAWNYDAVLAVLREARSPPVAVFCGHAHTLSYAVDEITGTHHVTLASPLEVEPGMDASAIVEAYADGSLVMRGLNGFLGGVLRL